MIKNYNLGRIKNNRVREVQFVDPASLGPSLWISPESYWASNAMHFNGTQRLYSNVQLGVAEQLYSFNNSDFTNTSVFSLFAWFKTNKTSASDIYVRKNNFGTNQNMRWGLLLNNNKGRLRTGGYLPGDSYHDNTDSPNNINYGEWNLIVGSYDGADTLSISLNGSGYTNNARTKDLTGPSSGGYGVYIGGKDDSFVYSGILGPVGETNYKITEEEINQIWNGGSGCSYDNLPASFKSGLLAYHEVGCTKTTSRVGHNAFESAEFGSSVHGSQTNFQQNMFQAQVDGDAIFALKNKINNQYFYNANELCGLKYNNIYPSASITNSDLVSYVCENTHIGQKLKYSLIFGCGLTHTPENGLVGLYSESNGSSYTDFRLNNGFPEFAISDGTTTHTLTCSVSAFKKKQITTASCFRAHTSATFPNQTRCTITVGSHDYYVGELISVYGVGEPFDTTAMVITSITPTTISYLIDNPSIYATSVSPENGYIESKNSMRIASTSPNFVPGDLDADVLPIGFVRYNKEIKFYINGVLVDTQQLPTNLSGSRTGSSYIGKTSRSNGPSGYLKDIYCVSKILTDDQILGLSAYFTIRISQYEGMGPLGVIVKADALPGINKTWVQNNYYMWDFGEDTDELISSRSHISAKRYAPGFVASYLYPRTNDEQEYTIKLSCAVPHVDGDANSQQPAIIFQGEVGKIRVKPPQYTTYVSKGGHAVASIYPNTIDQPTTNIANALRGARPYHLILLGSSGVHWSSYFDGGVVASRGPVRFDVYDDGGGSGKANILARTNGAFSLLNGNDFGFSNLSVNSNGLGVGAGSFRNAPGMSTKILFDHCLFFSSGTTGSRIISPDTVTQSVHQLMCYKCDFHDRGDYTFYTEGPIGWSFIGCGFSGDIIEHSIRSTQSFDFYARQNYIETKSVGKSSIGLRHVNKNCIIINNHADRTLGDAATVQSVQNLFPGSINFLVEDNYCRDIYMYGKSSAIRYNTQRDSSSVALRYEQTSISGDGVNSARSLPCDQVFIYGNIATQDVDQRIVGGTVKYFPTVGAGAYTNIELSNTGSNSAVVVPDIALIANSQNIASLYASGMSTGGYYPHSWMWQKSGDAGWVDTNLINHYIADFNNSGESYRLRVTDNSGTIGYSNVIDTVITTGSFSHNFVVPPTGI